MRLASIVLLSAFCLSMASAQTAAATYLFNDTLDAQESGRPSLTSVDPYSLNGFETATVYGQSRRVFRWDGEDPPADQAGLQLHFAPLASGTVYSIEMVFEFTESTGSWQRIFDVSDRNLDSGLYVDPDGALEVYPDGTGTTNFTINTFHHVVFTVDAGTVKVYLDGGMEIDVFSDVLDANLPHVSFFLDNLSGGGLNEYADGRIALLRVYDLILTDQQVATLAANPFGRVPGDVDGMGAPTTSTWPESLRCSVKPAADWLRI